jgi:hypothetical protein
VNLTATVGDACSPTVTATSDRSPGTDASGTYPFGTTQVLFTATDPSGNEATCTTSVTVRDTTPPVLTLSTDQTVLWPPNHRMVPVHLSWRVSDRCDPAVQVSLASVTSSEPDDAQGVGDGQTTLDVGGADIGSADGEILLRAERAAQGSGRTYEVVDTATDASGHSTSSLAVVTVPHDLEVGSEPIDVRLEPGGTPGLAHVYWNAVPGAEVYDIISGDVTGLKADTNRITVGAVRVPARLIPVTSWWENAEGTTAGSSSAIPRTGQAYFYLVQYRDAHGVSGFGTESASLPLQPLWCEGGCPGDE